MSPSYPSIALPPEVAELLNVGAALALSVSGGKDSQALVRVLTTERQRHGWPGPVFAVHADLGRAEWAQTPAHVERIARDAGVELVALGWIAARRQRGPFRGGF